MQRADLTIKEVLTPANHYCRSGHRAPALFRRAGLQAPEEPTKFFMVSSDADPNVNGTYCEPCLIVANAMNTTSKPK